MPKEFSIFLGADTLKKKNATKGEVRPFGGIPERMLQTFRVADLRWRYLWIYLK